MLQPEITSPLGLGSRWRFQAGPLSVQNYRRVEKQSKTGPYRLPARPLSSSNNGRPKVPVAILSVNHTPSQGHDHGAEKYPGTGDHQMPLLNDTIAPLIRPINEVTSTVQANPTGRKHCAPRKPIHNHCARLRACSTRCAD